LPNLEKADKHGETRELAAFAMPEPSFSGHFRRMNGTVSGNHGEALDRLG
jgi:hypothetical protein